MNETNLPKTFAHPGLTHRDGRQCIWVDGCWFVPLDVGGEGYACEHSEHDEIRAATTAPRADLDELGRLLAEAREEGYWAGYGEGKDEAETRDLNYDALTDQNAALLAEVAELRETVARVKALATSGPRGFDMNPTRPISGWDDGDWMDYLRRHEDYWRSHLTAALDGDQ